MEDRDKKILRTNHRFLLDSLPTNELVELLYEKGLFTDNDREEIQVLPTTKKRTTQFLSLLQRKGPTAYRTFIDALRELGKESKWILDQLENTDSGHTVNLSSIDRSTNRAIQQEHGGAGEGSRIVQEAGVVHDPVVNVHGGACAYAGVMSQGDADEHIYEELNDNMSKHHINKSSIRITLPLNQQAPPATPPRNYHPPLKRMNTVKDMVITTPDKKTMSFKLYEMDHVDGSTGCFGKVYKAITPEGKTFALKEFKTAPRSLVEVEILKKLTRHGNIVDIECSGNNENNLYCVVTDYAADGNLEGHLEKNPGPSVSEGMFVRQMAEGLRYLKKKNIIHLDIKPANILLHGQKEDEVLYKLCDFGCARTVTDEMEVIPIVGTAAYSAPEIIEQLSNNTHDPEQADLWSLGATLYKVRCGETPVSKFEGKEPTYQQIADFYKTSDFESNLKQTIKKPESPKDVNVTDLIEKLLQAKEHRLKWHEFINHPSVNPHRLTHRDQMRAINTGDTRNLLPIKKLEEQNLVHDHAWLEEQIELGYVKIGDQIWIYTEKLSSKYWHVVIYGGKDKKTGKHMVIELNRGKWPFPNAVIKEVEMYLRTKGYNRRIVVIPYESFFQGFLLASISMEWRLKTIEIARKCVDANSPVKHAVKYDIESSNCEIFAAMVIVLTVHYMEKEGCMSQRVQLSDTVANINATIDSPQGENTGKSRGFAARLQDPKLNMGFRNIFSVFGINDLNEKNYRELRSELMDRIEGTRRR